MIVVIDANIRISAFCFGDHGSVAYRALDYARRNHRIAIADEMMSEILQTLVRKFEWPEKRALRAVAFVLRRSTRVRLQHMTHLCRDPKDNMYLECAALAHAELLVTGDKDLLVLGSFAGTRIVRPAQYLELTS